MVLSLRDKPDQSLTGVQWDSRCLIWQDLQKPVVSAAPPQSRQMGQEWDLHPLQWARLMPGWIHRPEHCCTSSQRHYTKSRSLQRKSLISACFNHCCQRLSWISLVYHASSSTERAGRGVVFLLNQNASLLPSHLLAVEVRVNTVKVFCLPWLLWFKQNSTKV